MIPSFQELMLPVLKIASIEAIEVKQAVSAIATQLKLSEAELKERTRGGMQRKFYDRVNWAKSYLKIAGLVSYPKRGYFEITELGRKVLAREPLPEINIKFLENFPAFQEHKKKRETDLVGDDESVVETQDSSATPYEILLTVHQQIDNNLKTELLEMVRSAKFDFFEKLIIKILMAMGYEGKSSEEVERHLGGSSDEGVDGVILQDPLGVDRIYFQAKRYQENNLVGPGQIRDFMGALDLKDTQKGIFFTTSDFSKNALAVADKASSRIVLVNGSKLSELMLEYNLGCKEEQILKIRKLDEGFFDED